MSPGSRAAQRQTDRDIIVATIREKQSVWALPERLRLQAAEAMTLADIRIEGDEIHSTWVGEKGLL